MNFETKSMPDSDSQKLEEMFENLSSISKQLALLQGFMESKFGSEFTTFCRLSEQSTSASSSSSSSVNQTYESSNSIQDDSEEYDKMPNLVSQESPSRTLGYVTVPLRQTSSSSSSGSSSKFYNSQSNVTGITRRDRGNNIKEEMPSDNDDIMYPLHNFSDLLVESAEETETNESPEFLELELDPSTLLRGEPPALQPMFADNNGSSDLHGTASNQNGANTTGHFKRNSARQNSNNSINFHRYDLELCSNSSNVNRGCGNNVSRRASVGNHDSSLSHKKFDCLICGIKFEFAETLKSHMDSHSGSRNVRSNSEDQTGHGNNNPNAPPLPKLMPRPSITGGSDMKVSVSDSVILKSTRSKKSSSHQGTSSGSKSVSSIKRRRHYNQSRPCSLVCPECGLKIRDKSRLIEHLRGHTGERPFQCSFCDKSYTRKDVLKTHMVKMHGESPHI